MSKKQNAKPTKKELFLELAKPNEDGFSRTVYVKEFIGKYQYLLMGNGGDWCRDDGSLAKVFNIHRIKEKGKIIAIELHGYNKNSVDRSIKSEIKKAIISQKCVVLNISNVEVDHKDGRYDDKNTSSENQSTKYFQPLSKAANNAKRQHCKNCKNSGNRFDAKSLGYKEGQWIGNGKYRGSCVGCYWHDVIKFNQEISKNF